MEHLKYFYSRVSAEYLLVTAIALILLDSFLYFYFLILRNDAIHKSYFGKTVVDSIVLSLELFFLALSLYIFKNEEISELYALPMFSIAAIFTLMLLWGLFQINGMSAGTMEILETLVGVIEAGDLNLDGHSLHVQNLAMLIYDYLPLLDRGKINPANLQYAAILLDIGKLGIPREIIDKKGKLLPSERSLIQRHPEICVEILSTHKSFWEVATWIKYHHERVDGQGYYRLAGKDIPLVSRILALADTYSAITMDRSYRASLTHESAIEELKLVRGTQLDTELVDLFCTIPKSKIVGCMEDVKKRMQKYQVGDFRW
ncbi:HD-GYP domain-containing protein [Treponema zioleckii]|uniref:HD-GYP domain-containing protein n=1 Tax=Treponema zioleckii TaxID=331680 RepID=UPI00168BDB89|nr:HD domain-containing phosphohydrolase [Treponema zioleckii]